MARHSDILKRPMGDYVSVPCAGKGQEKRANCSEHSMWTIPPVSSIFLSSVCPLRSSVGLHYPAYHITAPLYYQ